jgi:uncharacterized protein GlcG (DUF336 family)
LEPLEERNLPDAAAGFVNGALYVIGSPSRDVIAVTLEGPNLVVRDAGTEIGRFASASVSRIAIATGDGSDQVKIAGNVLQPATIEAGAGNALLEAGGGPTTLLAGSGDDKLVGGSAADVLVAGSGRDTLIGKSGHDTLQAGSGPDKIFASPGDIILGAGPLDTIFGLPADPAPIDPPPDPPPDPTLTAGEVGTILQRAAAATPSDDGIVAIVDREGNILGVRVEGHVAPEITSSTTNLVFAIDGALAEARTGAFFANDQAPLTSRTVQFISQTTITQREVQSNPDIPDPSSTLRGPGFVAPIGVGGHFPPNVSFTPQVDLFAIEHTNRDSIVNPGPDGIKGTADDVVLPSRFNADPAFIPAGQSFPAPESYGFVSGMLPSAQSRGIGTLPGGVPIFKDGHVVGGIGVFFPGKTGFATEENSSLNRALFDPSKPDRSLEAELVALTAVGGSSSASSCNRPVGAFDFRGAIGNAPALPQDFNLPSGRIDLVGITLDIFGPGGRMGLDVLADLANHIGFGHGDAASGVNEPINKMGATLKDGTVPPEGWLVLPHAGGGLSADDVTRIITQGVNEALQIRAAIRLPLDSTARMVFAVTDKAGNVLGLYRMHDATIFSIDVAVAKARNVAYYADPAQLQPIDKLPGVPAGVAFTNRTFRYLAEPFFPEGIDGRPPGPFSILNDGGADLHTGAQIGPPLPASAFTSVMGHDAFNPDTNFHQPFSLNQNGIVFFPGSSPLYKDGALVGGLGVSGDGVDQDDDVTFFASNGFQPSQNGVLRSDQVFFDGLRLPYQNFNRNPPEPI